MNTLLVGEIHLSAEELLGKNTQLLKITNEQFLQTKSFPDVQAVVLRTFTPLKTAELQKFPELRYVVACSVGTDNLDLGALKQRNIQLVHCPGTNANSVAEHTLYLMLSLLREDAQKPYAELKNKTVGLIGFGAIGKLVAKKLQGFQARLIAFDVIEQDPKVLTELGVEMKDYDTVLREADLLTIHVPLNRHTEKMITSTSFERMKWNCFLINTSRAEVVHEEDLLQEYRDGRFRGIALDVCSPQLKEKMNKGNVLITDHCAAQGEDSFREQCIKPVEEFVRIMNGGSH
ncbi:hypothetical protein J4210_02765 [Candidatus Woesearchaeota archaeon]|nr:hypothetical protein [uncultured archaeon]MBS3169382.1 hypothetical protein [Candidatus Woesearchaeota archaeon]